MPVNRPIGGFECRLYIADIEPGEYDPENLPSQGDLTHLQNAKDVTLPNSAEELDVSARYSDEKKYLPGMFDRGVDFSYQYIRGGATADPVYDTLVAAYTEREPICIVASDGDITEVGTVWEQCWMYVMSMGDSQELGGSRTFDVSLRPGVVFGSGGVMLERGMGEVEE